MEHNTINNRVVHLFISSTFRDMHPEREALSQFYPAIKEFCRQRNLDFIPIDLRWGITEEEAHDNKTIEICLDEVSRCAPFFVGILGERYGWIPDYIPEKTMDKYPWLTEQKGNSITEMEVVLGAINNPLCLMYERVGNHNPIEDDYPERQDELKQKVLDAGIPIKQYSDPDKLAKWVYDDIKSVIADVYPAVNMTEEDIHRSYCEYQAKNYVPYKDIDAKISEYANGSTPNTLIISGKAGRGKSAILANYVIENDSDNIFFHFCSASQNASSLISILTRFLLWMKEHYAIECDSNRASEDIINTFPEYLNKASKVVDKLTIVIDGLDLSESLRENINLAWIPDVLPHNIKLILSAREENSIIKSRKKSFKTIKVDKLGQDEIAAITKDYLIEYGKKLDDNNLNKVASSSKTKEPFYLVTALDELRRFGFYDDLDDKVDELLRCDTVSDIIHHFITRHKGNLSPEDYSLFSEMLTLLYVSDNGLREQTLKDILDVSNPYTWSSLFLSVCELCYLRINVYELKNQAIKKAVKSYYTIADERNYAQKLIDYLIENDSSEKNSLLPSLCLKHKIYEPLYHLLTDAGVFAQIYSDNSWLAKQYWVTLTEHGYNMIEGYRDVIHNPERYTSDELYAIVQLFFDTNCPEEIETLLIQLIRNQKRRSDWYGYQETLGYIAKVKHLSHAVKHAIYVYKRQTEICSQMGYNRGLIKSVGNTGLLYHQTGNFDKALEYYNRALDLACIHSYIDEQQKILSNLSYLQHHDLKDAKEAEKTLLKQKILCEKIGSLKGLAAVYDNLSQIESQNENYHQAGRYLYEEQMLLQKIGDYNALQVCLGNYGNVLLKLNSLTAAIAKYKAKMKISSEIKNNKSYMTAAGNTAYIYMKMQKYDSAKYYAEEYSKYANMLKDADAMILSKQYLIIINKALDVEYDELLEELKMIGYMLSKGDVLNKLEALEAEINENFKEDI